MLTDAFVLDLSRLLPGGMCTRILADLGADVLKIEEPGRGDYLRAFEPVVGPQSALFNELNRGKRSLTLNLKHPDGRTALLDLAARADVLVESFRPGVLARLDLAPELLIANNPRLVVCSISGYGQSGPLRGRAGHDLNYLGYAGVTSLFTPRGAAAPIVPGIQLADYGGGAFPAAIGILAALLERAHSGRGRILDIAMAPNLLQWAALYVAELQASGAYPQGGYGQLSGGAAYYSVYPCADGRALTVAAIEPHFWANLCRALERADLIPLHDGPWETQERLFSELGAIFATRTRDEWLAYFGDTEVCIGPALSLEEALTLHSERLTTIAQPGTGPVIQVGGLLGQTATRPAPLLGQHSVEALAAIGYDPARIEALHTSGVV